MNIYNYTDVNAGIKENNINKLEIIFNQQPELLYDGYQGDYDTPFHYSAGFGTLETCKYFLSKGLEVNISLKGDETPLYVAAAENRIDIIKWLLENGAFINGLGTSILSPMMAAVYFNHLKTVQLLVENGADINRMHVRNGLLPVDIALSRGYNEIANYLKTKNAGSRYFTPEWINENSLGSYILGYTSLHAGVILPVDIYVSSKKSVVQKMAFVNNNANRMIFTFGLFKLHKFPIELYIVLPRYYNFYDKEENNQFPIRLLEKITHLISDGMIIDEGDLILSNDSRFSDIKWIDTIEGFFISEVKWKKKNESSPIHKGDEGLKLLTLIPIKKRKNGFEKQSIEKNRESGWIKLTLTCGSVSP
jgi:ankyrin repeat protein